jgi:UDP-N-acetylmuramoylalanine--D-glutamate ligase
MQDNALQMKVVIAGAGRTGCGLARHFLTRGARVILSDSRTAQEISLPEDLAAGRVELDLGGHNQALFETADLVVVSPGVPTEIPALRAAREKKVPVIGEIEVAARELHQPMAAITGTNGKSTVTTLMGDIFRLWGKKTFVGGNLGTPLIEAVDHEWDWLVVELSSFQLETIESFRPRFGLLLNISEDHLDRYPDMASYRTAKARLFMNMTKDDVAVLNADDPQVLTAAETSPARKIFFSSGQLLEEGMFLEGDWLVWKEAHRRERFPVGELAIQGRHNLENVMAALIPPLMSGCPAATAWQAATVFRGLPHRMALVGEVRGIRWFNDSKGTNIGSVVKSLEGCSQPLTLIAGGKDKKGSLDPLLEPVRQKVDHLVLIGEAALRMEAAFSGLTDIRRASSMNEAVQIAAELTPAGGTVLLSPGCSSFDMYRNYEERGRVFEEAVAGLATRS